MKSALFSTHDEAFSAALAVNAAIGAVCCCYRKLSETCWEVTADGRDPVAFLAVLVERLTITTRQEQPATRQADEVDVEEVEVCRWLQLQDQLAALACPDCGCVECDCENIQAMYDEYLDRKAELG